jgi:heme/copper-type cytochrome/quinol oxidase subunit 2
MTTSINYLLSLLSEGGLYIALTITIILIILSLFLAFNYAEKVYQYDQTKKDKKIWIVMFWVSVQLTNFFFLVVLSFEIYDLISK